MSANDSVPDGGAGLPRGFSSCMLINFWTLVLFRTAECLLVRTTPRNLCTP